jgi:hypothetical protein
MLVFWHTLGCNKEVRMSRKSYTAEQIIGMLCEVEVELSRGQKLGHLCRNLGITEQTYYPMTSRVRRDETYSGKANEGAGEGAFEYIEKYTLFDSARGAEILPAQRPGHPIEFYPEQRERNPTRHLFS